MSFAFAFSGDDIDEEGDNSQDLVQDLADCSISPNVSLLPAKSHDIRALLASLPSSLSFNLLALNKARENPQNPGLVQEPECQTETVIVRRALFDIRAQLMAEADPIENNNDSLLAGLEASDLTSGIYEGGFKTWECASDLAAFLGSIDFTTTKEDWHIIELGAGSAIPSLAILSQILIGSENGLDSSFRFSLCDYNEEVLRLVTAPNVFLTAMRAAEKAPTEMVSGEDEGALDTEDIDETRIQSYLSYLQHRDISFDFISGAWGNKFLELIQNLQLPYKPATRTLVLASETIYSPLSIKSFTETLLALLRSRGSHSKAYVAAKRVYFGVGGGVDEFQREISSSGAVVEDVLDIRTEGVGRVILQVTMP